MQEETKNNPFKSIVCTKGTKFKTGRSEKLAGQAYLWL